MKGSYGEKGMIELVGMSLIFLLSKHEGHQLKEIVMGTLGGTSDTLSLEKRLLNGSESPLLSQGKSIRFQ